MSNHVVVYIFIRDVQTDKIVVREALHAQDMSREYLDSFVERLENCVGDDLYVDSDNAYNVLNDRRNIVIESYHD